MGSWEDDTIRLTDPRAMRALAHPVRMKLLAELRRHGARRVGMLAEALDEAPASISYHLSTLARYDFVEEAPERARDRRERWWRATAATTSIEPAKLLRDPVGWAASTMLRRQVYEGYFESLVQGLEAETQLDPAWVAASVHSDIEVHIGLDELGELRNEMNDLFQRWTARSRPDADGTEIVTVIGHAFRPRP